MFSFIGMIMSCISHALEKIRKESAQIWCLTGSCKGVASVMLGCLILSGFVGNADLSARASGLTGDGDPITPDNASQVVQLAMLGRGTVVDVDLSPDGDALAVASSSGAWMYDADNLNAPARLLGEEPSQITSVAFSPQGNILAGGTGTKSPYSSAGDNTVRLWDAATGEDMASFAGHTRDINSVAFNPDGTLLASGSADKTVRLWDVQTGEALAVLEGHAESVNSVTFSPNGMLVASGDSEGVIRLWEINLAAEVAVFEGHTSDVLAVAFSPDGALLAARMRRSGYGMLRLANNFLLLRIKVDSGGGFTAWRLVPTAQCWLRVAARPHPLVRTT